MDRDCVPSEVGHHGAHAPLEVGQVREVKAVELARRLGVHGYREPSKSAAPRMGVPIEEVRSVYNSEEACYLRRLVRVGERDEAC